MADELDDLLELGDGRGTFGPPHRVVSDVAAFPALQIIAGIYKVLAVIAFVVGVIGVFVVLAVRDAAALHFLIAVAWTLLVPLFLWGSGELLLVFLRIEQNTRRAAERP